MPRRYKAIVAGGGGAVLVALLCLGAVSTGPYVGTAAEPDDDVAALGFSLEELEASGDSALDANLIAEAAAASFPDVYAGVEAGSDHSVRVFLTHRDPAIEAALREIVPTRELEFALRETSERDRLEVHERLRTSLDRLAAEGILVNSLWPDPATGKELVELVAATEEQVARVQAEFGPHIIVRVVPELEVATPVSGRAGDSAPWSAGW